MLRSRILLTSVGHYKVKGLKADYEWSEDDYEKYGTDAGYYKYEGDWNFDIPVTVDDSQTEVLELNDTNDAGIGLRSVIRTPYELTVNELYEDGSASDCFMVALDANGNKLPYNDSTGNCNNFTIQDRDISTVDIYILDYIQYMDELKGPDNYNNNEKNRRVRSGAIFSTSMQNITRPCILTDNIIE